MTRRPSAQAEEILAGGAAPQPQGVRLTAPVAGDAASPEALGRLTQALAEIRAQAILPMLRQAVAYMREERHREGAEWALKALEQDEQHGLAWHILAICREKAADFASALQCYERALQLAPDNPEIANDLGRLAVRLDMPALAEKLFTHYLLRNPGSIDGVNNLACALREQHRFAEAVEVLRPSIYAYPESALLWNTLGTVVGEQGDIAQAVTFFEEALRVDPSFHRARYNLANARVELDDPAGAIPDFEAAAASARLETEQAMIGLGRSTALLAAGDLERGWDAYEVRFDPHYAEALHYLIEAPRWTPDTPIEGKALLVVGEQGLGDEVLFANLLPDVAEALGPDGRLTLAVEPRLVPLFQRSFPQARVAAHRTGRWRHHSVRAVPDVAEDDFELYAPVASLLRRFRRSVDSFPARANFLAADPERVAHWRRTLDAAAPGPKAGVLWKSLRQDASRIRHFSPFEQWRAVLETPGVAFVNLQYGDCAEELARAREELGIELLQPPGIDLKDDLDDLAALTCALDLTVGPANATTNIAAACGAPVWLISTPGAWPRLGTDRYPWYPQMRVFVKPPEGGWPAVMAEIARGLKEAFPARG
jgi:tetratricopeptide (TPR) repeat protein